MKQSQNILLTLAILPYSILFNFSTFIVASKNAVYSPTKNVAVMVENLVESRPILTENPAEKEEILWLARIIFSETKNTEEMQKIAWVARNRVESGRWGYLYQEVALSPSQFSGLNSWDSQYHININLDESINNSKWKQALTVATNVYHATENEKIFNNNVQHFYSPEVVKTPSWAKNKKPVLITYNQTGKQTFRFYEKIK